MAFAVAGDGAYTGDYGDSLNCQGILPNISNGAATETAAVPELPSGAKPPTAEALAALANSAKNAPTTQPAAAFVGQDWRTQGDWVGRYGRQTAILCAAHWPLDDYIGHGTDFYDVHADIGPNHASRDVVRRWMSGGNSPHQWSLYNPMVGHRVQSEWDDHGEAYAKSLHGPDLRAWIEVKTPGEQLVSLYFAGLGIYRDYLVTVQLARNGTEADLSDILANARVTKYRAGVYMQFRN